MKNTMMKTAAFLLVFFVSGIAMAEMVDIGPGKMDRTDFDQIKAMVAGESVNTASPFDKSDAEQVYGLLKMRPSDVENLKNRVSGNFVATDNNAAARPIELVSIGPGKMTSDDFYSLKRMVKCKGNNSADPLNVAHLSNHSK